MTFDILIFIPKSLQKARSSFCTSALELWARAHRFFLSHWMVRRPCTEQDGIFSSGANHSGSRSPSPLYLHLISWHHFPSTPRCVKLVLLNFLINHPLLPLFPLSSQKALHLLWLWISTHNWNEQTHHHDSCHVESQKRYTTLHTGTATPLCYQLLVL